MTTIVVNYPEMNCNRKYFRVPEEHQLVVSGNIEAHDKVLNFYSKAWITVDEEDIGTPIGEMLIARKPKDKHDTFDSIERILLPDMDYIIDINSDSRIIHMDTDNGIYDIKWNPYEPLNF